VSVAVPEFIRLGDKPDPREIGDDRLGSGPDTCDLLRRHASDGFLCLIFPRLSYRADRLARHPRQVRPDCSRATAAGQAADPGGSRSEPASSGAIPAALGDRPQSELIV
jgi:hypothetical protein